MEITLFLTPSYGRGYFFIQNAAVVSGGACAAKAADYLIYCCALRSAIIFSAIFCGTSS